MGARRITAAAAVLVVVLTTGCSMFEDPEPATHRGLALPASEKETVDPALVASTVPVAGEAPTTTAPVTTAPPTTVDPWPAFIESGTAICREVFQPIVENMPGQSRDEALAFMRDVQDAYYEMADRLGALVTPNESSRMHLDNATRSLRAAADLMSSMIDLALNGQMDAYNTAGRQLMTLVGETSRSLVAAGLADCGGR